jgi:diguanylate cyclase (GGDEF)-like protein/PAS domain S-box-containing protein
MRTIDPRWLFLAAIVPGLAALATITVTTHQAEHKRAEQQTLLMARSLSSVLDREMFAAQKTAQAVALASDAIDRKDFASFYRKAKQILADTEVADYVVLTDASGQEYINTAMAFGTPLPRTRNLAKVRQVFSSGRPVVSDLIIGSATDQYLTAIDVPVLRGGKVVYDLSMGMLSERFNRILQVQTLQPGWGAVIFDRNGLIVARKRTPGKHLGEKVVPALLNSLTGPAEGRLETRSLEGEPFTGAYCRSALTDYTVAVAAPTRTLEAAVSKHTRSSLGAVVAGILTSLLLVWYLSGKLRRSARFLKRENEKNLALLHNASDGIHILDTNGNVIEASDSFCAMLGYTRQEVIGMNLSRWDAKFVGDELLQALRKQFKISGRSEFQTRHRRKDGAVIDVEVSSYMLELDGQPALFNSSRDITERKRVEAALRISEDQFRRFFEDNNAVMLLIDPDSGAIEDANAAASHYYGWAHDELCARKIQEINLLSAEQVAAERRLAVKQQRNYFVFPHRLADGSVHTVEVHSTPVPVGPRNMLFSIIHDVTDRKQAEDSLRLAASVFANSREGIIITTHDGTIVDVNKACLDITGYKLAEIVGQKPSLLKSGKHDAEFYAAMWHALESSGTWEGEIWNRRQNGEIYPQWLTIMAVRNDKGEISHYVATFTDISQSKAAEEEIKHLAFYDGLTGLPNRRLLLDRLSQAMTSSARSGDGGALLLIDLDNFKALNDTLGHVVGDQLLEQVAQRLIGCIREGDTVARLGGDEFVVILETLSGNPDEAATQTKIVAEKVLATLNQTYHLSGQHHHSTSSIGATLFFGHLDSVEILLKQADLAMYQAKAAGRNVMRFFDPAMQAVANSRAQLETDLRQGLNRKEFILFYQPQVDLDGRLTGAEALVRWRHPERGLVPPYEFIPQAEENGLILPLGCWVLETACTQLKAWSTKPGWEQLTLSVNISARQFHHPDFVDRVLASVDRTCIDPGKLKLEITESLLLDDIEDIINKMGLLKARGIGFSLDDFGTGYSSLAYLKRLPLDQLKIDQSFVRDVLTDPNDEAIARTIIALANSLGLSVIAEGVETITQRDFLAAEGCHAYQGFLFGRPGPVDQLELHYDRSLPDR